MVQEEIIMRNRECFRLEAHYDLPPSNHMTRDQTFQCNKFSERYPTFLSRLRENGAHKYYPSSVDGCHV